jgi:hypothetical protein
VGDRHLGAAYDLGLWRAPYECTEKYANINNLLTVMTMLFWVLIPCKQPSSALKMDKVFFPLKRCYLLTSSDVRWKIFQKIFRNIFPENFPFLKIIT